jgi:hypothetical protein
MQVKKAGGFWRGLLCPLMNLFGTPLLTLTFWPHPHMHKDSKINLQVQDMPISEIIPYARNPRNIKNTKAVSKVKASLKEFGWQQPIVIDTEGVIIAGHTRYLAAMELGMKEVPVHIATNLTPAQVKAYRIADNRTGQEATWDMELLALEFDDLKGMDFDLALTGFDADELAGIELQDQPAIPESSAQEIDPDDYQMGLKCPRCGFEFDDKQA